VHPHYFGHFVSSAPCDPGSTAASIMCRFSS
jgi:hypothetical protein